MTHNINSELIYKYDIKDSFKKTIYYYMHAANQGHKQTQFALGYIDEESLYIMNNEYSKSIYYLSLCSGHPITQTNLAYLYLNDKNDIDKAI